MINFAHAQEILNTMENDAFPNELQMIREYTQKRETKKFQFLDMLKSKYGIE